MNKQVITLDQTGYFSKIVLDYVANKENLKPFIHAFPTASARQDSIQKRNFPLATRKLIHEAFAQDYHNLKEHDLVQYNIQKLLEENTFTICTAHQPVIFMGPLYITYKIVQTILLCERYKKEFPTYHFVPVFYVGSEDHDLEEIGTLHVHEKTFQWKTTQQGACGEMHCEGLLPLWEQIKQEIDIPSSLDAIIQHAYQKEHTLTEAYRIMLNALFGSYGLLVFDANKKELKQVFQSVMLSEFEKQSSYHVVQQTNTLLEKEYSIQAQPRPINLFYKTSQYRERIEIINDRFKLSGKDEKLLSLEEIQDELSQYPERFSPNVILRPLLQESLLPNVAWIGGGGELAYWLQLKALFDLHAIPYPLLYLRNSLLLMSSSDQQILQELELSFSDLFKTEREVMKRKWFTHSMHSTFEEEKNKILNAFSSLEELASHISPNLSYSMEAHKAKTQRIVKRVEEKFISHFIQLEYHTGRKFDELKNNLFPNNQLQERYCSAIDMFSFCGSEFLSTLFLSVDPESKDFLILIH